MLKRIKKIIGYPICKYPNIDKIKYPNNVNSFSGNSLSEVNLFLLSNIKVDEIIINSFSKEGCIFNQALIELNQKFNVEYIEASSKNIVGPYDAIVNFFDLQNVDDNTISRIYHVLQVEVDYLVQKNVKSNICTIVKYDCTISNKFVASIKSLKALICGLGTVLPAHSITSNGIIADSCVENSIIMNAGIYLSGKYGCVLNGEVLELGGKECG